MFIRLWIIRIFFFKLFFLAVSAKTTIYLPTCSICLFRIFDLNCFGPSGSDSKSCGAIIICVRLCDTYYTLYTHRVFKNDDHLPEYFFNSVLKRYYSIFFTTTIICCYSNSGNKAVFV